MPDMPSSAEQPAKAIAPATAARSRAIRKMFSFIEDLSAECGQAGALGSAYLVRSVSRIARHVRQIDSSTRDRETRRLLAGITSASRRVANGNAWRHSRGGANSEDSINSVNASRQDKTLIS